MTMALILEGDAALDLVGRLGVAALCGGVLGLEREWAQKPAGLRTQVLVTVGCALFTAIGQAVAVASGTPADITRIAASIAPGLGFLGAGTIIRGQAQSVRGLTTAALVWVNGAIGMAVGFDMVVVAVAATLLALAVLILLRQVEWFLTRWHQLQHFRVVTTDASQIVPLVRDATTSRGGRRFPLRVVREGEWWVVSFRYRGPPSRMDRLTEQLLRREDVLQLRSW